MGAQLDIEGTNEMGAEAGSGPTLLMGIAVGELTAKNIHGVPGQCILGGGEGSLSPHPLWQLYL